MTRHKAIAGMIFTVALLTSCNAQREKEHHGPFQFVNLAAPPIAATITYDASTGACTQSVGGVNTPFVDLSIQKGDRITWAGKLVNAPPGTTAAGIEIEYGVSAQNPGSGIGTPFRTQDGAPAYYLTPASTIGPLAPVDTSTGTFKFAFVEIFDNKNKAYQCTPPPITGYGVHVQQ